MTTTMIVMTILIILLVVSLLINCWAVNLLRQIDADLPEDGMLFGWTVEEYEKEIEKLNRENAELSAICEKQTTTIDFLMGRM